MCSPDMLTWSMSRKFCKWPQWRFVGNLWVWGLWVSWSPSPFFSLFLHKCCWWLYYFICWFQIWCSFIAQITTKPQMPAHHPRGKCWELGVFGGGNHIMVCLWCYNYVSLKWAWYLEWAHQIAQELTTFMHRIVKNCHSNLRGILTENQQLF